MGVTITPKNRREIAKNFKENWIRKNENAGNPDELTPEEIDRISSIVGNHQVKKEQKHHKAWLKGDTTYKYLGQTEHVMTQEIVDYQARQFEAMKEAMEKAEADKLAGKSEEE